MSKNLMIIESPNKIKTISNFLKGEDFQLIATYGHLRDLSKFGMGFDKNLDPKWVFTKPAVKKGDKKDLATTKSATTDTSKPKRSVSLQVQQIREAAKKSEKIYLSTDPDREGEAISWHVWSILDEADKKKCVRIIFNEITEQAIKNAFKHPKQINMHQVDSYLARRILDREFGFKLSGFVKSYLGGFSAGRVQSVALRFLKDREDEIKAFVPESWFTLDVTLANKCKLTLKNVNPTFTNYALNSNVKDGKVNFTTKEGAQAILNQLSSEYTFSQAHPEKFEKVKAKAPYKTSTMQQDAINKLHYSSKTVESLAQKLYEGVNINGETISLITYPRTDRNDLSTTFIAAAKEYITKTYGTDYYKAPSDTPTKKTKAQQDLVQGAHEGIRPSHLEYSPEMLKPFLKKQEYQLYVLIWTTALGSLMSDSVYAYQYCDFTNNGCLFTTFSRTQTYDGFEKIYQQYNFKKTEADNEADHSDQKNLDKFILNNNYAPVEQAINQHDKKPPARFNEASLIKILEKMGIGRPSTYSTITNTVINRDYAEKNNNALVPTQLGIVVVSELEKLFPEILSYNYTRQMEEGLDQIESNHINWKNFLHPVFDQFNDQLTHAKTTEKKVQVEYVDRKCPNCDHELIYRKSRRGRSPTSSKFIACSYFPRCRYTESLNKPQAPKELLDELCPECQSPLIKRLNWKKQEFIGCSGYPNCHYIKKDSKKTTKKVSTKS